MAETWAKAMGGGVEARVKVMAEVRMAVSRVAEARVVVRAEEMAGVVRVAEAGTRAGDGGRSGIESRLFGDILFPSIRKDKTCV